MASFYGSEWTPCSIAVTSVSLIFMRVLSLFLEVI